MATVASVRTLVQGDVLFYKGLLGVCFVSFLGVTSDLSEALVQVHLFVSGLSKTTGTFTATADELYILSN